MRNLLRKAEFTSLAGAVQATAFSLSRTPMIWSLLTSSLIATQFCIIDVSGASHHHEYSSTPDCHALKGGLYLVSQQDTQISDEVGAFTVLATCRSCS